MNTTVSGVYLPAGGWPGVSVVVPLVAVLPPALLRVSVLDGTH